MRFTLVTKAILSITTTCLIGFIVFGFLQYSYIKDLWINNFITSVISADESEE